MIHFRDAVRALRSSPGFVVVAVVSLGLALGVTTATYAILDAVVNPVVPFDEPERLFNVSLRGDGRSRSVTSYDKYAALRDRTSFHEAIALRGLRRAIISSGINGSTGFVNEVGSNYFAVSGIEPEHGRVFSMGAEDEQGAIISFDLWRRWFPGQRIGDATITIDDRTHQVIGVLPPGMPTRWGAQVWLRLPTAIEKAPSTRPLGLLLRLKPGATIEAAKAQLRWLEAELTTLHGVGQVEFFHELHSVTRDELRLRGFHVAMGGAAFAVLLIACANLANLMLARGMRRRREVALRMAIGATRSTIVKQLVTESALIALAGGGLGMAVAVWANQVLVNRMPPSIELIGLITPSLSWRVFVFGIVATGVTILLFGLLPALRASDVDLSEPLKDSAGSTTGRMGSRYNLIVIMQIAVSLILLVGAGLLVKAARRVGGFDFGYDPRGLLRIAIPFPRDVTADSVDRTFRRLVTVATDVAGVRAAAMTRVGIPDGRMVISDVSTGQGEAQLNLLSYQYVSHGFLEAIGIPVTEGRDFLPGDEATRGAVIVDETAARMLWPDGDPVGRRIKLGDHDSKKEWLPLVGVARTAAFQFERDPDMLALPPEPAIYAVGVSENTGRPVMRWLVVRVNPDGPATIVDLTTALRPFLPQRWTPMLWPWLPGFEAGVTARHFIAGLFGVFGTFALVLASVGLYGVLAYAVSQRMREFGVRLALGARDRDIAKIVFHDGFVMLLAGTGIGALVAMWSAKLLSTWLYDIPPTDVTALVAVEAVVFVVSMLACSAPGLRAARANPLDVLRAT